MSAFEPPAGIVCMSEYIPLSDGVELGGLDDTFEEPTAED